MEEESCQNTQNTHMLLADIIAPELESIYKQRHIYQGSLYKTCYKFVYLKRNVSCETYCD